MADANNRFTDLASGCFNRQNEGIASYSVNANAVAQARRLIDAHQYVLESVWGDVQPTADDENAFLESHPWNEYAEWHLGLTDGPSDDTKARYAFVYGELRRVHRMGLIACQYRAAEWRHKEIELAAHELLQHFDNTPRVNHSAVVSLLQSPPKGADGADAVGDLGQAAAVRGDGVDLADPVRVRAS